jgi:hypothetical protein
MPSPLPHTHVCVRDLSELTAGIPGLFGFPPVNSVVLLVFRGPHDISVSVAMRVTLPEPEHISHVAQQLLQAAKANDAVAAIAVLVGGGPGPTPQRAFVNVLRNTLAAEDIVLVHASWVARLAHAEPWWCYDDPLCGGQIPDPQTSTLAAAMAVAGKTNFPNRSALARQLTPDLTRLPIRRKLLRDSKTTVPSGSTPLAEDLTLIHAMIHRAATTTSLPELTDEEAVRLARALSHMAVRDECMAYGLSIHAEAAERLWTVLVRGLPAPERVEPAALLAMSAYLRGDGVLAALAVETARRASENHQTATLLEGALQRGAPPRTIRRLLIRAIKEAHEKYPEHTQHVPALPVTPVPTGMEKHPANLTGPEPPPRDDPPWETDTPTPQPTTPQRWSTAEAQTTSDAVARDQPSWYLRVPRPATPSAPVPAGQPQPPAGDVVESRQPAAPSLRARPPLPIPYDHVGGPAPSANNLVEPPRPAVGPLSLVPSGGGVAESFYGVGFVPPTYLASPNPPIPHHDRAASPAAVPVSPASGVPDSHPPGGHPEPNLDALDHSGTPQAAAVDLIHALLAATAHSATAPSVPG